jgi:signal transduction histidine kinase
LGFVLALQALNVSRREKDLLEVVPWMARFHRTLVALDYPLTADALSPIGEMIAALVPDHEGWILLARIPGVLVGGEVMRGRFLRVAPELHEGGGTLSSAEGVLRYRLEEEENGNAEITSDPDLCGEKTILYGIGRSVGDGASLGVAIALPESGRRRARWLAPVVEAALDIAADHFCRMSHDVVRWRGRITGRGGQDPLILVRALVHELSGELNASIIHLERSLNANGEEHSALVDRIRRSLTLSGYWVDLLRDIPLFRDDFLAISRRRVPLRAALIDVIDDVRPAWPDCVFHLCMAEDATVLADRHLRSIVRNLLYNAASYSPIGGTVDIEVRYDGRFVHVLVADQGPGVRDERLERIFNPFQDNSQVDDRAGLRSAQGMGIGLSVARIIARAYGGDLRCYPKPPAKGGRFEVILPLAEEREDREVVDHA